MTAPPSLDALKLRGANANAGNLLRAMQTVRALETVLRDASLKGRFEGPLHVSLGQESVAVGVTAALESTDIVVSNHRGHGHALAFGLDPTRVMAEIVGSPRGTNGGVGGSMHIFATAEGFMGTNGIVGDPAGIGVGVALASKVLRTGSVVVAFIGDGAMGSGIVYEAMNLAVLWQLPFVLVCENNGFAEMTPTAVHLSSPPHERARAFGMVAETVEAIDVDAVHRVAKRAVESARLGRPAFVEALTYRWTGHYVGDPREYRPPAEEDEWRRAHDPIRALAQKLGLRGEDVDESQRNLCATADAMLDEILADARS